MAQSRSADRRSVITLPKTKLEPTVATPTFSIRAFLRDRSALLVHFSTCMSAHEAKFLYPEDLRNAARLQSIPLSFSTIQPGDIGPFEDDHTPRDGNAAGSIGLIVDITETSVLTVGHSDDGTSINPTTGALNSGGQAPNEATCAASIDNRSTVNEWFVQDFRAIGIFVFLPAYARAKTLAPDGFGGQVETYGDLPVQFVQILADFPEERIFTTSAGVFRQYGRRAMSWSDVSYDAIIGP